MVHDTHLSGYAWAENVGWIHFKNAAPAYNVVMNAGNIAPDTPTAVSPADEEILAAGTTSATLDASDFSDPESDSHNKTYWWVRRADKPYEDSDFNSRFSDQKG